MIKILVLSCSPEFLLYSSLFFSFSLVPNIYERVCAHQFFSDEQRFALRMGLAIYFVEKRVAEKETCTLEYQKGQNNAVREVTVGRKLGGRRNQSNSKKTGILTFFFKKKLKQYFFL